MKVKILKTTPDGKGGYLKAGKVAEVDTADAKRLLAMGKAEAVKAEAPKNDGDKK